MKKRRMRFLVGGGIIVAALLYLIVGGLRGSMVYFITPSELQAQGAGVTGKPLRLGGMVAVGSMHWDLPQQRLTFRLSDGTVQVPVLYRGTPPDLFKEGRGAVVEGTYRDGIFQAHIIMAKHSEEYEPPQAGGGRAAADRIGQTLVK